MPPRASASSACRARMRDPRASSGASGGSQARVSTTWSAAVDEADESQVPLLCSRSVGLAGRKRRVALLHLEKASVKFASVETHTRTPALGGVTGGRAHPTRQMCRPPWPEGRRHTPSHSPSGSVSDLLRHRTARQASRQSSPVVGFGSCGRAFISGRQGGSRACRPQPVVAQLAGPYQQQSPQRQVGAPRGDDLHPARAEHKATRA